MSAQAGDGKNTRSSEGGGVGNATDGRPSAGSDMPRVTTVLSKDSTAHKAMHVKDILRQVGSMRRAAEVDKILGELDRDKDGTIDMQELLNMVESVVKSRRERRYMWFMILALFLFALATIGAVVGLTYAVVEHLKDTEVAGSTMYVKGSTTEVVRTGSAEFTVVDGVMVSRSSLNTTNATVATTPLPSAVLQTASFVGTPQSLSSRIDIKTLFELKFLHIKGAGEVELGVVVNGVARVPMQGSTFGTVVRIITAAGTITLDGTTITFSSEVADIFVEAGFRVSRNRRVLLGFYEVLGFFNTIKDLSVFNLPSDQAKPHLPSSNFLIKLKIYEQCVVPDTPMGDRCIYTPPKVPDETSDVTADTNTTFALDFPPAAPEGDWVSNGSRRSVVEAPEQPARHYRHRYLRTVPHRSGRSLQEVSPAAYDIAGVEVVNGVRYMAHNETSIIFEGFTRVVYDYMSYPQYQKVEVMKPGSDLVYQWQQNVLPADSSNDPRPVFCRNYTLPPSLTSSAAMKADAVKNFTYLGIDTLKDGATLARHFQLVIKQSFNSESLITVDYWDSPSDQTPIAFSFEHPMTGKLIMEVLEFRALTVDSPEAVSEAFVQPNMNNCPVKPFLPRLVSPFHIAGYIELDNTEVVPVEDTLSESQRRMVLEQSSLRAAEWAQLDHDYGTGVWPQWALDAYGGVHPEQMKLRSGRALMGADCTKVTASFTIPAGPCSVGLTFIANSWPAVQVGCGASYPPLVVEGNIQGNMCEKTVKGCVSIGVGLAKDNWLAKKLKIESITLAEVCIGYDFESQVFYVEGTFTVWLLVAKAELSFAIKFSACCIWLEEVKVEGFIGFEFGFGSAWYSVGSLTLITERYFRGSAASLSSQNNPTVINEYTWKEVYGGEWGDWGDVARCGQSVYSISGSTATSKFWGRPMNAFDLRMELDNATDDTALNGLRMQCSNGDTVVAQEGLWGGWYGRRSNSYGYNNCSSGSYFVGARLKFESPGGDDTAANSIEFKCNNGWVARAHDGFWGDWTNSGKFTDCPSGTYICGVQVRFESFQGTLSDDTALNGLRIYCCAWYQTKY